MKKCSIISKNFLKHPRTVLLVVATILTGFIFSCGGANPLPNNPIIPTITGSFTYTSNMLGTVFGTAASSGAPTWTGATSNQTVTYSLSPAAAGISIDESTGIVSISATANVMPSTKFTVTASGTGNYGGTKTTTIDIAVLIPITGSFTYAPNMISTPSRTAVSSSSPIWTGATSGQTVSYSLSPTTAGISIDQNTGVVSISAAANAMSSTIFTVTASGTGNYTGTQTATIDIVVTAAAVAGSFVYNPSTLSTVSGTAAISSAPTWTGATSGQTVSYSLSPAAAGISIDQNTGIVSIDANANVISNTRFTVTASGTGNYAGTQTATIDIVIAASAITGSFGYNPNMFSTIFGTAVSSGAPTWTGATSNQTVTYSLSPSTAGISIDQSAGIVRISTNANVISNTRFTVTASGTGNYGGTKTTTIDIEITTATATGSFTYNPNMLSTPSRTPASSGAPIWTGENYRQTMSYSLSPSIAGISIDQNTGIVNIGTNANMMSSTRFTITASGMGNYVGTNTATIDIEISNPVVTGSFTYTPNIINTDFKTPVNSSAPTWTGGDPEQTLSYSLSPPTVGIGIDQDTGIVSTGTNAGVFSNRFIITASGKGNYLGTKTTTIDIVVSQPIITGSFTYNPSVLSAESGIPGTNNGVPTWTGATPGQTVRYSLPSSTNFAAMGISIIPSTGVVKINANANPLTRTTVTITAIGTGDYIGTRTATIDIEIAALIRTLKGYGSGYTYGWLLSVAWSPDGTQLASGSRSDKVRIWNTNNWGEDPQTFTVRYNGAVNSVAWSTDGTQLASGNHDSVRIWRVSDGTLARSIRSTSGGHRDPVLSVAWSPDGNYLASGSGDNNIKIWDTSTWSNIQTLTGHSNWVQSVAWSPDSTQLASGSEDRSIKIWNTSTWSNIQTLTRHTDHVNSVAWNFDGTLLASGSDDRSIKIWNTSTWSNTQTLNGHTYGVFTVAWSPDSTHVASGSQDKSIKIWRVSDGMNTQTLTGHFDDVFSVAWNPDGTHVASGSKDESIKIWPIDR